MNEAQRKKYAEVVAKAWSDEGFKQKLIANPKETLKEMGVEIPSNVPIKVCDGSDGTFYLVIPPKPKGKLDEEQLKNMQGGKSSGGCLDCFGCFSGGGQLCS